MSRQTRETGQQGEHIAQSVLQRKGFSIQAVNWRLGRLGEIDVVAYHPTDKLLAFIEVKTRKSIAFGTPQEAVDTRKQAQLLTLAEAYLCQHPPPSETLIRFDVISIHYPGPGRAAIIEHIENAFSAEQ